jgi:hypothetical protein
MIIILYSYNLDKVRHTKINEEGAGNFFSH